MGRQEVSRVWGARTSAANTVLERPAEVNQLFLLFLHNKTLFTFSKPKPGQMVRAGGRAVSGRCERRTEELPAAPQSQEQVRVPLDAVIRTGAPPSCCFPTRMSLSWSGAPSSPWTLSSLFPQGPWAPPQEHGLPEDLV